jgi:fructuronate reductase
MTLKRGRPAAPVRIVHIGAGAFFKAHQAWYTSAVDGSKEWGIAAFSGRSSQTIDELNAQDCVYTLIARDAHKEDVQQIESITSAFDGSDEVNFSKYMKDSKVSIVTITVTEAGYRITNSGELNLEDPIVIHDIEEIKEGKFPTSALFRLAYGLHSRKEANAGPIAIVPCDNFPNNGKFVENAIKQIFAFYGSEELAWLTANVSFVSTSVDRITPKVSKTELEYIQNTLGIQDSSPVVTEMFSDWILQGDFPAGRPQWEKAGAKFVAEIAPFESRKLWFLNGAHSLIAYQGLNSGHTTVDEAIRNPEILSAVNNWWDEAEKVLQDSNLELSNYRIALLERFNNQKISHQLAQIAIDGSTKLALRIAPVAEKLQDAPASAFVISQWVKWVVSQETINDTRSIEIQAIKNNPEELVTLLSPSLAHSGFMHLVNAELKTTSV